MKLLCSFLAGIAILGLTQCKPAETPMEEPIPSDDVNMAVVEHPISDYAFWKAGFDAHDSTRQASGIHLYQLARGIEDTNQITAIFSLDDVAKAKAFAAMPELKAAMDSSGVTGPPVMNFLHVVRRDTSDTDIKERVMVSHHVKDYAAWLKVYDQEGLSKRAEHGLIDRGLARSIDDSNMVFVVFAVSDMAKAKARTSSTELKDLMTSAGVDGPPRLNWYRLID